MRNKLYAIFTGMLCLGIILACDIPQSVTVKGSPGVYVNLDMGSKLDEQLTEVYEYLDRQKIVEIMGADFNGNIRNYRYDQIKLEEDSPETINGITAVQTYLIHFPIAEQSLNLTEYMESAEDIIIPAITIPVPDVPDYSGDPVLYVLPSGYLDRSEPLAAPFDIDLSETSMAQWMSDISVGGGSGIKLTNAAKLKDAIRLRIPQFGINYDLEGVVPDGSNDLHFINTAAETVSVSELLTSLPNSKKIEIFVQICGAIPGETTIDESQVVFNWVKAKVKPSALDGSDGFSGTTEKIDIRELIDKLGGVKFTKIPAYLFLGGVPGEKSDYTLVLKAEGAVEPLYDGQLKAIGEFSIGDDEENYGSEIGNYSAFISLEDELNTGEVTISYEIKAVNSLAIEKATIDDDEKITADLVVVLPLQFTSDGDVLTTIDSQDYVKLDLDALQDFGSDGDLFQRDSDSSDDIQVKGAKIEIKELKNKTFEGLFLGVTTHGTTRLLSLDEASQEYNALNFDKDDTVYPFEPKFDAYIKDSDNLTVKPKPAGDDGKIRLKIAVTAEADINIELDF